MSSTEWAGAKGVSAGRAARTSSRKSNGQFEELCREYRTISERIDRLERSATEYVTVEIEVLKRRRSVLLQEILALRPKPGPDRTETAA